MIRPILAFFVAIVLVLGLHGCGHARDLGQWENTDPLIKKWYQLLLQPDSITPSGLGTSCCGEGDAYYVSVSVKDEKIIATIDDDRDNTKLGRIPEVQGAQYVVPPNKIVGEKQRLGNPTGRAVLFLGATTMACLLPGECTRQHPRPVLCFVDNSGS